MHSLQTDCGIIPYGAVREAMDGEPYTMSLTDEQEIHAVIEAVNQGIDSYLEACFCPERGDRYEGGERKAGRLTLCRTLECRVSPESLPVLLRRLFDLNADEQAASHRPDAQTPSGAQCEEALGNAFFKPCE